MADANPFAILEDENPQPSQPKSGKTKKKKRQNQTGINKEQ
jgi:hypothetical protein